MVKTGPWLSSYVLTQNGIGTAKCEVLGQTRALEAEVWRVTAGMYSLGRVLGFRQNREDVQ